MFPLFIPVRFIDIIDILIVAFLLYQIYMLIKGTIAINIFIAVFSFYLLWLIVKALNMQLMGIILGPIIGAGVIAIIVVFQQELRRFLVLIGTRYFPHKRISLDSLFQFNIETKEGMNINALIHACNNLSKTKIGALIVIRRRSPLYAYEKTGQFIDAEISNRLLETIFNKNSPLHDGAVIIDQNRIRAAACILPVSESKNLPQNFGLRHRAGIGLSEESDALVIIISEETGKISVANKGYFTNVNSQELYSLLRSDTVISSNI